MALARDGEGAQVYNVCSGGAVTIRDVLRELIAIARVPVEVREDPQRMRRGRDTALGRHPGEAPRSEPAGSAKSRWFALCATSTKLHWRVA